MSEARMKDSSEWAASKYGGYVPAPYDQGGVIPAADRIPVRLADREKIICSDGRVLCHHADDGRIHDHGHRIDMDATPSMLDELNREP